MTGRHDKLRLTLNSPLSRRRSPSFRC